MHLRLTEEVVDELRRRDIALSHVHEVVANGPVLARRVLIGPDDGGRLLALSVEPAGPDRMRVTAGRPAERAEILAYRTTRRRPSFAGTVPVLEFEVALDEATWALVRREAERQGVSSEEIVRRALAGGDA